MTTINAKRRELFRGKFARLIHNGSVRVRIYIDESSSQPNPHMKAQAEVRRGVLEGFECSVFPMLSGKLTRLFRARLELQMASPGLLDAAEFMVQFVPNKYILRTTAGLSTNAAPSATSLTAAEDFTATFVKVGAKVTNVTDGSSALVTNVAQNELTVEPLSGGTLNVFTAGDSYTVDNSNELMVDDQVEVDSKWRTVLAVISDSEGIQETVLLGD